MSERDQPEGLDADLLETDQLPSPDILAQWDVPEPSADLVDRIARRMEQPFLNVADGDQPQPLEPAMPSAAPDISSSRNSLALPVAIGFAVAAGLLAAFWAGRATVSPPAVVTEVASPAPPAVAAAPTNAPKESAVPPVEVTAKSVITTPPTPEVAEPGPDVDVTIPRKDRAPRQGHRDTSEDSGISADLKNPFGAGTPPAKKPAPRPTPKPTKSPKPSGDAVSGDLENPFSTGSKGPKKKLGAMKDPFSKGDSKKTSILRIATRPGVPSAAIKLDGVPVGDTPKHRIHVRPGRHKIVFTWSGGRTLTKYVEVADGAALTVRGG